LVGIIDHMHIELFLSAVTNEFRSYRDSLRTLLKRPNVDVHVQEDFIPTGTETLDKLDSYVARCDAVIHIAGDITGAWAGPATLQTLRARYADLGDRLWPLKRSLESGDPPLSYTQWEAYLAVYHRKPLVIAVPEPGTPRDEKYMATVGQLASQHAHLERLRALDRHPEITFGNTDQLAAKILRSSILDLLAKAGVVTWRIALPYPSIGGLFKGRDEFLRRLQESLARSGQTAIVSQALYGLGGVGKTRTVVEYAWAHAREYSAVLFVIAETPEALWRNITALAGKLVPTLETTNDELRCRAVLDWLNASPRWLLILDNVDTPAAMAEAERLLRNLAGGHVVITSRLANFPAHVEPLELDVLTADDAVNFLLERTNGRRRSTADDAARAREVAEELGHLALALEVGAAYVAKRRLTFGQYLRQWRSNRDEVLGWWDATVTGYPSSVAATWRTSVGQLSEAGRRLLERLAWLAPEKIPEALLDNQIAGAEGENLSEALDDLSNFSLVTRDAEGPYFLVHRLVQDVTRRSLPGDARHRSLVEALGWIDAASSFEAHDVRFWPEAEALAPHAKAVTEHADAAEISKPTARLMNHLGLLFQSKALHAQAEPLFRRALTINETSLGPERPEVAVNLNNLAELLRATDRMGEAEPLFRRALTIFEKSLGSERPEVAVNLNNLALLLRDTNRLSEAEPLFWRALAINETSLGPDHPQVATNLNNLAELLRATNRLGEAEPLHRRALAINETSLGPDHPQVAADLNNLALLLEDTNRLSEAEPLHRRALAINETSFGPDHPQVATSLNNLASLLQATNRFEEAEPHYRRALAINEKSLGPDHPQVATSLNNLASLLQATNRFEEAEPVLRRALAIFEKSYGPDHPSVATNLNNLAGLLLETNRLGETEPLLQRALAIKEKSLGPDHPSVATNLNNLAELLRATNRLSEAEPLHRRALAINEKSLGPDHPQVAADLNYLALLLENTNRLSEAEPLHRRALAINEKSLGPNHPQVATSLNNLASLLQATKRFDEAEPHYRRALAINEKSLGPDHPSTVMVRNNLSGLHSSMIPKKPSAPG
jgi:tetratricopeptide (TPR) repeat protein